MKKEGFTLTELIGVITILGIIVLLAFPNLIKQIKDTRLKLDKATEQLIIVGTTNYVEENKNDFPSSKDETYCVSLRTLIEENKIPQNLKDSNGNNLNLNEKIDGYILDAYDFNIDSGRLVLYTEAKTDCFYQFFG